MKKLLFLIAVLVGTSGYGQTITLNNNTSSSFTISDIIETDFCNPANTYNSLTSPVSLPSLSSYSKAIINPGDDFELTQIIHSTGAPIAISGDVAYTNSNFCPYTTGSSALQNFTWVFGKFTFFISWATDLRNGNVIITIN